LASHQQITSLSGTRPDKSYLIRLGPDPWSSGNMQNTFSYSARKEMYNSPYFGMSCGREKDEEGGIPIETEQFTPAGLFPQLSSKMRLSPLLL